jgi:transcriptional regulator with XRE-family HTH domain
MLVARGYASSTTHNRGVSSKIAARFGQRVRELRIKKGLSQVEMAYRFGIDRGHISEIEAGKENVCLPMLEVLSKGFGISVSELLRGV